MGLMGLDLGFYGVGFGEKVLQGLGFFPPT